MQNKLTISKRGQTAPTSPIRELVPFADAAKAKGIKIYHINIGDPDFPLPDEIKETLQTTAQNIGMLPYPPFQGQKDILDAWKKYYQDIALPYPLQNQNLIITAGGSFGLVLVAAALIDPGDEILVFEPFYAPYVTHASFVSAKLVGVPLDAINGYHLPTKEEIMKHITSKTKAIFFTNPNNPTGTVFTREEMQMLLDIAREYNIFIVSDETYRGIAFDNRESISILHVAKEKDLPYCIIVDSLSKRLNMCGARMGVVVSKNEEVMTAMYRFTQGLPLAAAIEQQIAAPMLSNCLPYIASLKDAYQKRRDAFVHALEKHLTTTIHQPEGALYTMVQLPVDSTYNLAKWLLTDFQDNSETVMISPGSGFYVTPNKGLNEARVAYVLNEKDLERSAELLALGVKEYNARAKG